MVKKIRSRPVRKSSPEVTREMAVVIKVLLALGVPQHKIAAIFNINPGRVSEINTGKKFSGADPDQGDLFI
ncbi:hypothetical protein [Martelella sp. FOR1707]